MNILDLQEYTSTVIRLQYGFLTKAITAEQAAADMDAALKLFVDQCNADTRILIDKLIAEAKNPAPEDLQKTPTT